MSATATDVDGNFVIRGAGRIPCVEFEAARQQRGDEFVSIAGWVDGYLTGLNESRAKTFDITPWQSTELMLSALAGWCGKHPRDSLHTAMFRMVDSINSKRLLERSETVEIPGDKGGPAYTLYIEVIRQIQLRLKLRGLLTREPNGQFDNETRAALREFQASRSLPQTGLPDQVTLANLL
jgi:hypothetical protein